MSYVRWFLSLLIVYHLAALGAAAIPEQDAVTPVVEVRHPSDPVAATVTPLLDRAGMALTRIESVLTRASAPVRRLTRPYINAGLGPQQWQMFSTPYTEYQYVRLDYYVMSGPDTTHERVLRELVLPADREEQIRMLHQFRDKVILNTLETFLTGMAKAQNTSVTAKVSAEDQARLLQGFDPIVDYFSSRVAAALDPTARLARVEFWFGTAPIPARGASISDEAVAARLRILEPYRNGPAQVAVHGPVGYRQRGALERESDISWTLMYIKRPNARLGATGIP
jgi:hypothetical protein